MNRFENIVEALVIRLLGHNGSSRKVGSCSPIQIAAFCNTDFPPLSFKVIEELLLPLIDFENKKKRNSPSMNAAATHRSKNSFFPPPPLSFLLPWRIAAHMASGRTDGECELRAESASYSTLFPSPSFPPPGIVSVWSGIRQTWKNYNYNYNYQMGETFLGDPVSKSTMFPTKKLEF